MNTNAIGTMFNTNKASSNSSTRTEQLEQRDLFMSLLVAQLKNQDPLQPQDGTEFVAQLTQFNSLDQLTGIHESLDQLSGINKSLDQLAGIRETLDKLITEIQGGKSTTKSE